MCSWLLYMSTMYNITFQRIQLSTRFSCAPCTTLPSKGGSSPLGAPGYCTCAPCTTLPYRGGSSPLGAPGYCTCAPCTTLPSRGGSSPRGAHGPRRRVPCTGPEPAPPVPTTSRHS